MCVLLSFRSFLPFALLSFGVDFGLLTVSATPLNASLVSLAAFSQSQIASLYSVSLASMTPKLDCWSVYLCSFASALLSESYCQSVYSVSLALLAPVSPIQFVSLSLLATVTQIQIQIVSIPSDQYMYI